MTRKTFELPRERTILYVGSAGRDLNTFPAAVRMEFATALEVAKLGGMHASAKPWKGLGPHVYEIALNVGGAYRAVYTVQFKEAVYVLDAFQKKSTQGIKTPQREVELIKKHLKVAVADHRERYGGKKEKR